MNKKHKYETQIKAVSREAACFLSAPLMLLVKLLNSSTPAKRGASVCLLRDFARGNLPPLPLEMREQLARHFEDRLEIETDPFLRELIVRELALLLGQDTEPPLVHLQPSEN